ncbi:ATP synthase F0 [Colletotrichum asianum]
MVPNILPNWARIALSIATIASHLPQYHRILEQGHCDGLSLYYVLFNIISATEQLTLGFFLNVNDTGRLRGDAFVNDPATAGDWLNFVQLVIVWLCSLVLLLLSLRYSASNTSRQPTRYSIGVIYLIFILVSLVPAIFDAIFPDSRSEPRNWGRDLFVMGHYLILLPVSSILVLASAVPQAREIQRQSSPGAISVPGFATQTVVFALLAISWMVRVRYPPYSPSYDGWYRLVGWPVVNNGHASVDYSNEINARPWGYGDATFAARKES